VVILQSNLAGFVLNPQPLIVNPALDAGGRILREAPVDTEARPIPACRRLKLRHPILPSQNLHLADLARRTIPDPGIRLIVQAVTVIKPLLLELRREPRIVRVVQLDDLRVGRRMLPVPLVGGATVLLRVPRDPYFGTGLTNRRRQLLPCD